MTALLWLRRDLRVHDHPALHLALAAADRVVPVFCLDERLLRGRHASGSRTQFLLECLADLGESLRNRGGTLIVRRGRPEAVLPELARQLEADIVSWTEDVGPFARARDHAVRRALTDIGVDVATAPGLFVVADPTILRSSTGGPYRVFTPFHRAWLRVPRPTTLPAPRSIVAPTGLPQTNLPTLDALGLEQMCATPAPGGEQRGRREMERFVREHVAGYGGGRDELGGDASSRLSPYLHFGCISARELEERSGAGPGPDAFRRQLCWRDFYAHVLANFPANAKREFQPRYRGTIRWIRARGRFAAWCDGATGYPLIDAAMRQLREEGWMHNRARLAVGSFLTKDLGIDWRWGERWFMRLLIDGDEANNNGNWQWIASVGVDPQPAFRRIYNPARQQQRFDPRGEYVRRYVPELRHVPDEYLAQPWTMPEVVQEQARCVIGRDYPRPIVDHAAARREALERYARAQRPQQVV
jgi:deoxyribodipyrimidine photo-lyase